MAVISITEARGSGYVVQDISGVYSFHRTLLVKTDDPDDGEITVLTADGMPQILDTFARGNDADTSAPCINRKAVRDPKLMTRWTVDLEYKYEPGFSQGNPGGSSPTYMLPEIRFFFAGYTEPVDKDKDGKVLANTVGTPYNPKLTRQAHRLGVEIRRNEEDYDPAAALSYIDGVNTDTIFGGITARQAQLTACAGQRKGVNNVLLWEVTYEILFNKDTWDRVVLNEGFTKQNPDWSEGSNSNVPRMKAILDASGFPITEKVPLTASGDVAAPGAEIWNTHRIEKEVAFADLDLPPLVITLV